MKILIADDHDLLLDTLVIFLEGEGNIETVTASDFMARWRLLMRRDRLI